MMDINFEPLYQAAADFAEHCLADRGEVPPMLIVASLSPSDEDETKVVVKIGFIPMGEFMTIGGKDAVAGLIKDLLDSPPDEMVAQMGMPEQVCFIHEAWAVLRERGEDGSLPKIEGAVSQQADRQECVMMGLHSLEASAIAICPMMRDGDVVRMERTALDVSETLMNRFAPPRGVMH